jgi:RNA polymerase sigma factor (sigma-70 family)
MPFRSSPVKWENEDGSNSRYKNVGGFKYDVIKKSVVYSKEEMPKYFLADTSEEAEALYKDYDKLLNNMSFSYAKATGVSKSDLFGEALIGLGRARRDWNEGRSTDFKILAIYYIKDALNEFVRKNSLTVHVPAYIKKSHYNLEELKRLLDLHDIGHDIVYSGSINIDLPGSIEEQVRDIIIKLHYAAERADVPYEKFIDRIEYIPTVSIDDLIGPSVEEVVRHKERIEAALIVDRIKEYMDDEELSIAEGIMEGKSYREISEEHGQPAHWSHYKIKRFRDRLLKTMEEK